MAGWLQRKAYRISVGLVLLIGLWLRWPTLYNGFFSDDHIAFAMVEGVYASARSPLDLFDFTDGSATDHTRLMAYGSLPWWTVDGLRMAMMRPLSSALILLDQQLFDKRALLYHVHSMLWWIALVIAAAGLFEALLAAPIALLATLLFALEEGHTFTVGWIANRGALVAMTFCLLGLRAHLRWRRQGVPRAAWLSALCFSIALLSGEWAFPLMGYVLSFELIGRRSSWRDRAIGLLPCALPSSLFALVRAALGYGTHNSGVYTDPINEPLSFIGMMFERIPVFFADMVFALPANYWSTGTPWRDRLLQSGWIPTEIWLRLPSWQFWQLAIGCCAIALWAATLAWVLSVRPLEERRELTWLTLGSVFSLLPMVSSFPHGRLVLPASLGFAPLCAAVMAECYRRTDTVYRLRRFGRMLIPAGFGVALLYFQVFEASARDYDEARASTHYFTSIRRLIADAEIDDRTIAQKRVVVLGVIEHTAMVFSPYVRWVFGHPLPKSWWTLSAAPYAQDVYRPAPNVLEVTTLGGLFLKSEIEQLYRAERFRMHPGQLIAIDGLRVEIVRMLDGFPQTVRFTFDRDIDDPEYVFLFSSPEGLGPVRLPEVGSIVRLRRPSFGNIDLQNALRANRDPNVSCVGQRPPLNECRSGFGFSDCGGFGRPVFACTWQNDCRWFSHGCVAEEYDVSSCQPDHVCCQHDWPFGSDSFTRELLYSRRVRETLYGWGPRGYDVARQFAIEVHLDPRLRTRPDVRCLGPHADGGPCDLARSELAEPARNSLFFVFRPAAPSGGWSLSVEMIDQPDGELRARVCQVPMPPLWTAEDDTRCALPVRPICADAGTLVLNMFPVKPGLSSELRARVEVDFPDGLHVEAEL